MMYCVSFSVPGLSFHWLLDDLETSEQMAEDAALDHGAYAQVTTRSGDLISEYWP